MMVTFCPYHFYIFLDRNLESLPTFKVDVYLYLAVSYLDFLKDWSIDLKERERKHMEGEAEGKGKGEKQTPR